MALLTLMVHGPDPEPTVCGLFRGGRAGREVWRDGPRLRVEGLDGTVDLIADEHAGWLFDRDHDAPVAAPRDVARPAGAAFDLLVRREPNSFLGDDFTRPTGRSA